VPTLVTAVEAEDVRVEVFVELVEVRTIGCVDKRPIVLAVLVALLLRFLRAIRLSLNWF